MLRLKKYTKPYLPMIFLAIILLYGQANFDLSLPDHLSRIVNVGIQQGGVEDAVPIAIRQTQLDRCQIFMDDENESAVQSHYALKNKNSSDYKDLVKIYPLLKNEPIYLLNTTSKLEREKINMIMAKTLLVVNLIDQIILDHSILEQLNITLRLNISAIPEDMDVWEKLADIHPVYIQRYTAPINEYFNELGDELIIQTAIQAIQIEYLSKQLNSATSQAQNIAVKVIEGASGVKALSAVNEIALEQARNVGAKK